MFRCIDFLSCKPDEVHEQASICNHLALNSEMTNKYINKNMALALCVWKVNPYESIIAHYCR